MGATSVAGLLPTLLMLNVSPERSYGPWPDPTAVLRGARKSYADPRCCHQPKPQCAVRTALFAGGFGATAPRIGRPEQSVVGHGDRIGGGLAERFDDGMTLRLQGCDTIVREAALDPHFIGQPLVVQARGCDRGGHVHIV